MRIVQQGSMSDICKLLLQLVLHAAKLAKVAKLFLKGVESSNHHKNMPWSLPWLHRFQWKETETSITAIIGIGCCSSLYDCHSFLISPCMLPTCASFQKDLALPCPDILSRKQWMETQVLRSTGPDTWNLLKSLANLWRSQPVQMFYTPNQGTMKRSDQIILIRRIPAVFQWIIFPIHLQIHVQIVVSKHSITSKPPGFSCNLLIFLRFWTIMKSIKLLEDAQVTGHLGEWKLLCRIC